MGLLRSDAARPAEARMRWAFSLLQVVSSAGKGSFVTKCVISLEKKSSTRYLCKVKLRVVNSERTINIQHRAEQP